MGLKTDPLKYAYRVQGINVAAGLTNFEVQIQGEKITYASPTDGPEITIRLQSPSHDEIPLRPQGEIVAPFTRIYVSSPASPVTIRLMISGPRDIQLTGRDANIGSVASIATIGELQTIINPVVFKDFFLDRAQNAAVYEAMANVSSGASTYAHLQVWNPVGSGKTVVVQGVMHQFASGAPNYFHFRQYNTALTTLIGTFSNLRSGEPSSSAELRSQSPTSSLGTTIWMQPNGTDSGPIFTPRYDVLSPGKGLVLAASVVNLDVRASMRIWEFTT